MSGEQVRQGGRAEKLLWCKRIFNVMSVAVVVVYIALHWFTSR